MRPSALRECRSCVKERTSRRACWGVGKTEECRGQRGGAGGAIMGRSCASKVAHKVHVFTVVYYYTFTMYLLDVNPDLETFYRM